MGLPVIAPRSDLIAAAWQSNALSSMHNSTPTSGLVGPCPQPDLPRSRAEVFVEEGADFAEGFFRLGSLIVELVLSV